MNPSPEEIRIGLIGFGTVGQGVGKYLQERADALARAAGRRLVLGGVAVRDLSRRRAVDLPTELFTADPWKLVRDPDLPLLCELAGGTEEPRAWTAEALRLGKTVVTANKALLCDHGEELFALAGQHGGRILFEASVAGGIPVIEVLRDSLAANRVERILGILNGTSNYILTRMEHDGLSFGEVLESARANGFVEADESLDLDGWDAAHKTVLLAWLTQGRWVSTGAMAVEGIRRVSLDDLRHAREMGYRIKLIGAVERVGPAGRLALSVRPSLVPLATLLADVDGVFNAVRIDADLAGPIDLIGRGAGQDPTASAVLADLVTAARQWEQSTPLPLHLAPPDPPELAAPEEQEHAAYLRLTVADRMGVLAEVAGSLSRAGISIASVLQRDHSGDHRATLVLLTHRCTQAALDEAVRALAADEAVGDDFLVCPILD
jgi:homoserine dehydrogenase